MNSPVKQALFTRPTASEETDPQPGFQNHSAGRGRISRQMRTYKLWIWCFFLPLRPLLSFSYFTRESLLNIVHPFAGPSFLWYLFKPPVCFVRISGSYPVSLTWRVFCLNQDEWKEMSPWWLEKSTGLGIRRPFTWTWWIGLGQPFNQVRLHL